MNLSRLILSTALILAGCLPLARGQSVITLGTAASYAVFGGSTVTNTGATVITGDLGLSPSSAIVGFPPGTVVGGTVHAGDGPAALALTDATTAYNLLAGEAFTQNLTGQNLGSLTLTNGVYHFDATAQLSDILTLDAGNNANARFDFQIGSTFGTAASSQIVLINGAQAANVFWQVGTSATFFTSSSIVGTVLAHDSITANLGTVVDGRLLALNAAVTLDTASISVPSAVPEPAASAALAAGGLGLIVGLRRIHRRSTR